MPPRPALVHAALLLVSVLFGLNFVLCKELFAHVPVRAWVFWRIAAASLLLLPVALGARRPWPPLRLWIWLFLAAFFGMFLNQLLFSEGLERTTPEHSAIINTSIPILTLLFAVAARQERFTAFKLMAIATSLCGVLILLRLDELLGSAYEFDESWLGDLLTLGNATSFSIFLVLMRRLGQKIDALTSTTLCFAMATALMGVWSSPSLDAASAESLLAPKVWPLALTVILGGTVLTYLLNNWALRHVESSQVVLYIYVQPIVATVLACLLGYEFPGARFFLAAGLVCSGILIQALAAGSRRSTIGGKKRPPPA